ncbi:hypothetical protein ACVWZW_001212 [Bradyrhizobium sp. F1.13.4]
MEAAIDRIMHTYDLLANRTSAASAEAREKVTNYLNTLMEAGEKEHPQVDGLRADLSAAARRQRGSREGGVYRAVRDAGLGQRVQPEV